MKQWTRINTKCTIHSTDSKMYIYKQLNCCFNLREITRVAGINSRDYWALNGHIAESQGGSSLSSPIRSEGSWVNQAQEAGPCDCRPRLSKLGQGTISLKPTQIKWFLCGRAGGCSAWVEADSRATFLQVKIKTNLRGSNESRKTNLGSQET
jgi:hypothetical protein